MSKSAMDGGWITNETTEWDELGGSDDPDPPDFLPMREPLQPRVPDLCPDDRREETAQ